MKIEKFLQLWRFKKVLPYLNGDVMDFGGNKGELKEFVKGNYLCVNYNHSVMERKTFDTIVALAVIAHMEVDEVYKVFKEFKEKYLKKEGIIFLTTPTRLAKMIYYFLSWFGFFDKENAFKYKSHWNKKYIYIGRKNRI